MGDSRHHPAGSWAVGWPAYVVKVREKLATLPAPDDTFVLLVTGSREAEWGIWADVMVDVLAEIERWLNRHPVKDRVKILRHGKASGIDSIAHAKGPPCGYSLDPMPADWKHWGRRSGIIRNHAMTIKPPTPSLCTAFFASTRSPGTADCAAQAHKAGIPTVAITVEDLYMPHEPVR